MSARQQQGCEKDFGGGNNRNCVSSFHRITKRLRITARGVARSKSGDGQIVTLRRRDSSEGSEPARVRAPRRRSAPTLPKVGTSRCDVSGPCRAGTGDIMSGEGEWPGNGRVVIPLDSRSRAQDGKPRPPGGRWHWVRFHSTENSEEANLFRPRYIPAMCIVRKIGLELT